MGALDSRGGEHRSAAGPLWLCWVLANTAGICLGSASLYALIAAAKIVVQGVNEDRLFGSAMLPVLVMFLAISQWIVLRRRVKLGWWLVATAAGSAVGLGLSIAGTKAATALLGQPMDVRLIGPIVLTLAGFGLALGQWAVLRHLLRASGWWVLASVLGYYSLSQLVGESIDRTTDVIAVGALPAAFTGVALALLWKQPAPRPADKPASDG